ncbi:MAG: response regulator [Candidatus Omnitrophica bacterium]|nr:response regulator [Candidatus Omnitrophota bacterium]
MEKNILIVEDEAIIASGLKLCLNGLGYNVFKVVSNGEDAIESLKKNNPDIILMDIRLNGEKNGYETVNAIRKSSNTPVIYLIGGDPNQIDEKAKYTKPYDYIIKPFDMDVLTEKIEKITEGHLNAVKFMPTDKNNKSLRRKNKES